MSQFVTYETEVFYFSKWTDISYSGSTSGDFLSWNFW